MTTLFLTLLIPHIICGFTALFSALGAMLSKKGFPQHRRFGRFFFYAMTGIFITAIPLALIKNNIFLFLIAFFSYYFALTGWRYAKNHTGQATLLDWVISLTMLFIAFFMLGFSFYLYRSNDLYLVLLIFGLGGILASISDLRIYYTNSAIGKIRIVKHLGAMLGATIATITAFAVTNIPIQPQIILWLGPTLIITPIIIWWTKKILSGKKYG